MTNTTDQAHSNESATTPKDAFEALDALPTALKDELQLYITAEVKAAVQEAQKEWASEPPLWTVKQVADYLSISKSTAEKIIAAGDLKYTKVRGQRRFDRKTVFAYARKNVC
jgi:excisionase family DNA binding protein